ncbi:MAG TPA: NUDIX domain-containing protein [Cytophagales bacterium]|nr:NUDIX domain-containing protein [Cytophagales bacterium]
MKTRPSALIIKDSKILTLKYVYNGAALFALPGGNVEHNETIKDTLIRELEEELGINIIIKDLFSVGETYNPEKNSNILHLTFIAEISGGSPVPNPEHTTCLGVEWIDIQDVAHINMYPNIAKHIAISSDNTHTNKYLGLLDQKWL